MFRPRSFFFAGRGRAIKGLRDGFGKHRIGFAGL
jgi:hypothetical protein